MRRTLLPLIATLALLAAACGDDSTTSATTTAPSGAAATSPSTTKPAPKAPFAVGALVCQTGALASAYVPAAAASKAWAKTMNDNGGINGHPIDLTVVDDGCDAAKSLAAVKDLVESKKVLAFVSSTPAEPAWADYIAEKQVPAISGATTTNPLWGTKPMMFPVTTTSPYNTLSTVASGKAANATKARVIYCAEAPSCKANADFWEKEGPGLGVPMAGSQQVASAAPNFTAECLAAKKDNVDFIQMAIASATGLRFVADCQKQDYNPTYGLSGLALSADFLTIPNLKAIGSQTFFPWFLEDPATKDFLDSMKKYGDSTTSAGGASGAWLGLTLFGKIAQSLPDTATPADVLNGLWALKGETLGGLAAQPLTYPKGGTNGPIKCFFFVGIKDGKTYAPNGLKPTCLT